MPDVRWTLSICPVPRDRNDDAYFAPLNSLSINEANSISVCCTPRAELMATCGGSKRQNGTRRTLVSQRSVGSAAGRPARCQRWWKSIKQSPTPCEDGSVNRLFFKC